MSRREPPALTRPARARNVSGLEAPLAENPAGNCCKCGSNLPEKPPGPGRPPSYCSVGCRRAAEYELRRLDGAIEREERQLRFYRSSEFTGSARAERVAECEAELARLETRMRVLLDDDAQS